MTFAWNKFNKEHLREMWAKGLSARKIAQAIGNPSRNSVVGMAHRLGLERRPSPISREGKSRRAPRPRPMRYAAPKKPKAKPMPEIAEPDVSIRKRTVPVDVITGQSVKLAAAGPHHCRWIIGDVRGADTDCCGSPVAKVGEPYCAEHRARSCGTGTPSERRAVQDAQAAA